MLHPFRNANGQAFLSVIVPMAVIFLAGAGLQQFQSGVRVKQTISSINFEEGYYASELAVVAGVMSLSPSTATQVQRTLALTSSDSLSPIRRNSSGASFRFTPGVSTNVYCGTIAFGSTSRELCVSEPRPVLPVTVDIRVNGSDGPFTINSPTSLTLSWTSSNATSCSVAPFGWTDLSASRAQAFSATTVVSITCTNSISSATDSVRVNLTLLPPVTVNVRVNGSDGPLTINGPTAMSVSWSSTNATACSISPGGWTALSGSGSLMVSTATAVTMTCTNFGSSATDTVRIQFPFNLLPIGNNGGDLPISYWWAQGFDAQNPYKSPQTSFDTAFPTRYTNTYNTERRNIVVSGMGAGTVWGHFTLTPRVASGPAPLTTGVRQILSESQSWTPIVYGSATLACPANYVVTGFNVPNTPHNWPSIGVNQYAGDARRPYNAYAPAQIICSQLDARYRTGQEVWVDLIWNFGSANVCPQNYALSSALHGPGFPNNNRFRCSQILLMP